MFDQLNQPRQRTEYAPDSYDPEDTDDAIQQPSSVGRVSGLKLDAELQKKSEALEREAPAESRFAEGLAFAQSRSKRKEQSALPETVVITSGEQIANVAGPTDLRITTFESEIDPFEFSLLDSGHFVLFRKVWRDGERYIQGLLVDREPMIREVVGDGFTGTALADMTNLIIAYQDDVIHTFTGRDTRRSRNVAYELGGTLLYRSRLAAPLNGLELIFSIKRLPPGPGASVLGWVTLVLAIVFIGGFLALYRVGLSQINLARQQQDFVAAVSHELKSPLTSIRMYGEMLKEGWADEDKRQAYYEFIHDESERLSRLISNVLQLARITRNEPQFDARPTKVAELMSKTESKISSQIERAGFELRISRDEDADRAMINVDEDCFAQMIINLVDNAIKFSRNVENKIIEISSKLSGDNRILFSVRDHGPGIAKDQMKKIFQLFYRSESELTRETVGTGIGLAIVHQLAVAMDGNVDMVNAEPGAEFRIRFPVVSLTGLATSRSGILPS
jgi:signal transduction histidine kinase